MRRLVGRQPAPPAYRIRGVFEELNFPSREKLRAALKKRDIPFREEELDDVVYHLRTYCNGLEEEIRRGTRAPPAPGAPPGTPAGPPPGPSPRYEPAMGALVTLP